MHAQKSEQNTKKNLSYLSEEKITTHSGDRPKKPVKRDIVKRVRFTKSKFFVVKQKAAKAGIGISSFIRKDQRRAGSQSVMLSCKEILLFDFSIASIFSSMVFFKLGFSFGSVNK